MGQVIFITGTDTGVGKTLFTGLWLTHLLARGCHALAMKPFCSGGTQDARFLSRILRGTLPIDVISPFQFKEPLAPLMAGRRSGRLVPLSAVLDKIRALADRCDLLLVEGAGGLLVPLGERYSIADLISSLACPVILVARNRLGAINHTLLTLSALEITQAAAVEIVLMDPRAQNGATRGNAEIIREWAAPRALHKIPFLGPNTGKNRGLETHEKNLKKTLARIMQGSIVRSCFAGNAGKSRK